MILSSYSYAILKEYKLNNFYCYNEDTIQVKIDTIRSVVSDKNVKAIKEVNELDDIKIEFVGTSELQKAISDNSEIPANAGVGVFLTKTYGKPTFLFDIRKLELELRITIASTVDTIIGTKKNGLVENSREFGNSILLPYSSRQSVAFYFRTFESAEKTTNWVLAQNWGFEGSLIASNRLWKVDSISRNISTLSINFGVFSELLSEKLNKDGFSISAGIDLTGRWIFGDLGQSKNNAFRNDIIGTKNRFFWGIEPCIIIKLKNIKATASFPILMNKDEVTGLTKGQFVTSIRFTGGFPIVYK